jgi:hypothetical protein
MNSVINTARYNNPLGFIVLHSLGGFLPKWQAGPEALVTHCKQKT